MSRRLFQDFLLWRFLAFMRRDWPVTPSWDGLFVCDPNIIECYIFAACMRFCSVCALTRAFSFQCDALFIGEGVRVLICSTVFAGSPTCGICARSAWALFPSDCNGECSASYVAAVCLLVVSFLSMFFFAWVVVVM